MSLKMGWWRLSFFSRSFVKVLCFRTLGGPRLGNPGKTFRDFLRPAARLPLLGRGSLKARKLWPGNQGGGGLQNSDEVGGLVGGRLSSVLTASRRQKSQEDQVAETEIHKQLWCDSKSRRHKRCCDRLFHGLFWRFV